MADILPKSKVKGVDICGDGEFSYIVRSDLGYYMSTKDVHRGLNITVRDLHPACQGGDHYCAFDNKFYIIKGNSFRCVSDLSKDSNASVDTLHPNCRGGDHYVHSIEGFLIIFQSRGVFRKTTNLATDLNGIEKELPHTSRNGLYYWSANFVTHLIKPKDEWGVQFHSIIFLISGLLNLMSSVHPFTSSVHPDILNFLPGGLAVTHGTAFAKWELIKTITNDSDTPITWEKRITRKVGYTKSKSSSIEHNWKLSTSTTLESGELTSLIAKFQFSLTAEYGGAQVNTEHQSWDEATEMEEKVNMTLQPNKKIYVWQYKLGFGREDVLFCRDLSFDDDPNPPSHIPLPPSNK